MSLRLLYFKQDGSLAERSKAPASGAGPKGREFESRSCHFSFVVPNMPAVGRDSGRRLIKLSARSCGPMDKASVYGTGDCRFESYQDQFW